jgi:hypothetical protein
MALAFFLAGAAQGHPLIQRDIIANHCGFTDDHTHPMVNKEASSNNGSGMNLDTGEKPGDLRQNPGGQRHPMNPEPVRYPMGPQGLKPRITQQNLHQGFGCGIPFKNGLDVFPNGSEEVQHGLDGDRFRFHLLGLVAQILKENGA